MKKIDIKKKIWLLSEKGIVIEKKFFFRKMVERNYFAVMVE